MMKKLLSLLLALAMLLGCTAFAEGVDYTGTWVLTGAESAGMQMGPETLVMVGLEMTMTFHADGTMSVTTMGMEETGTWVATATGIAMTDDTETIEIPYQNEMLLIDDQGTVLMFTREGAAPAVTEAIGPVALSGVPAEAFEGQWLLTHVNFMGMDLPAEQMGVYMALVLSEGAGLFGTTDDNGNPVAENITYAASEVEGTGTVLQIFVTDETTGESVVVLALLMAEDGTLYLDESGVTMYFTKQVEEAAE